MKILPLGLFLLLASACVSEPLTLEAYVQQLEESIQEIELECVPQRGTPRNEVELIFGEGRPLQEQAYKFTIKDKPMPPIPPDSAKRGYTLCDDGYLIVLYDSEWKVRHASYSDTYYIQYGDKNRVGPPTDYELVRLLEPRLKQMKIILSEYRIKKDQIHEISQQ